MLVAHYYRILKHFTLLNRKRITAVNLTISLCYQRKSIWIMIVKCNMCVIRNS